MDSLRKDRLDIASTFDEMRDLVLKRVEETGKVPRQVVVSVLEMSDVVNSDGEPDIEVFMTTTTDDPEVMQAILSDSLRQTLPQEDLEDGAG